jgi:putative tryptophan/tyrosine transport system substrate-binding protein
VTGGIAALSGKLLQVLVDAVPRANRLGVLWFPVIGREALTPTEDAARALKVKLKTLEVRSPDEFEKAFIAAKKDRTHGLVVLPAVFFTRNRKQLVELSIKSRLPTIHFQKEFAGFCLMALAFLNCTGAWVCLQVRS